MCVSLDRLGYQWMCRSKFKRKLLMCVESGSGSGIEYGFEFQGFFLSTMMYMKGWRPLTSAFERIHDKIHHFICRVR